MGLQYARPVEADHLYTAVTGLLADLCYLAPDDGLPAPRADILEAIEALERGPWRLVEPRIIHTGPTETTAWAVRSLVVDLACETRTSEERAALVIALGVVMRRP